MQYILQTYGNVVCSKDWHVDGSSDFCRFYYARGGEAVYSNANGDLAFNAGSLYVLPAGVPYDCRHNPENPFRVLWFHARLLPARFDAPIEIKVENHTLQYHLLQSLMLSIWQSPQLVDCLFAALFELLGPTLQPNAVENPAISRAIQAMNADPGNSTTNKQLAELLGYSEKYFIRLFTRCVGLPPHQYAANVRLGHAVKHLMDGKSVKETAALLGYCSAANFSRDFRLHYKMSPRQYALTYARKP